MIIGDISETLENILRQGNYRYINPSMAEENLNDFCVSFAHPSTIGKPDRTTFNLFLFDIRENTSLMTGITGYPTYSKTENKEIKIIPPAKLIICSYFVTVWPNVEGDLILNEQRLLSQALQVFAGFTDIPEEMLVARLKSNDYPLPSITMLSEEMSKGRLFDLWPLLKIDMRAAFTMTVNVSMPIFNFKSAIQKEYLIKTINYKVNNSAN